MRRRRRALLVPLLAAAALVAVPLAPSGAVTDTWAQWGPIQGTANAYTTTMQQASPGFPAAAVASDSRSNVQIPSGASTFLDEDTPPGATYGSSEGEPYLNLRPRADNAGSPSTTTYTFEAPTPDAGWAFVLGDIDADQVSVAATGADGAAVPAATIDGWFQGTFNYAGDADEPTWDPATSTLTGNAGAVDTSGASGWFEPDEPLTSLTMTFTRRAGFPVYQTWFVSRARPVAGTVSDVSTGAGSCAVAGTTLELLAPSGDVLGTTSPGPDGGYSFGEVATQTGYTVRIAVPAGCAVVGPAEVAVDNRGEDGSPDSLAAFEVRAIAPQPISGTVRDDDGAPVAGVDVTLTRPDGTTATTTTDAGGAYLFDDNPVDDEPYTVSIAVPPGFAAGPDGTAIDDVVVDDVPITDQDFVVVALATVSGTVTGGGDGVADVRVVITPEGGGDPLVAVTGVDGTYEIPAVPPGSHAIALEDLPAGYGGGASRPLVVADVDVTDVDFALALLGGVGGAVTDGEGAPVAGVQVVVDGPGGGQDTLTTDDEGGFLLDGLEAGDYEITVVPPEGTEVEGPGSLTASITEAGELVGGLDFVLVAAAGPEPTPDPTEDPTDEVTGDPTADPTVGPTGAAPGGGGAGSMPATGADLSGLAWAAALLAAGAVAILRGRRTRLS